VALSFGFSDYVEGGVLAAVIFLNVSIGFFQEYQAEKKLDSLRALSSPSASVLRDGKNEVIPRYETFSALLSVIHSCSCSAEVVPGDIIILKTGDTIPADIRVFEAMNLNCDEKSLTGEAESVEKRIAHDILVPGTEDLATEEGQVGIGDRFNMAYSTTAVTKGRGRGIVTFTGMQTEVGKSRHQQLKRLEKLDGQ
jgi:magnesium-transporting ATPase (P-type)